MVSAYVGGRYREISPDYESQYNQALKSLEDERTSLKDQYYNQKSIREDKYRSRMKVIRKSIDKLGRYYTNPNLSPISAAESKSLVAAHDEKREAIKARSIAYNKPDPNVRYERVGSNAVVRVRTLSDAEARARRYETGFSQKKYQASKERIAENLARSSTLSNESNVNKPPVEQGFSTAYAGSKQERFYDVVSPVTREKSLMQYSPGFDPATGGILPSQPKKDYYNIFRQGAGDELILKNKGSPSPSVGYRSAKAKAAASNKNDLIFAYRAANRATGQYTTAPMYDFIDKNIAGPVDNFYEENIRGYKDFKTGKIGVFSQRMAEGTRQELIKNPLGVAASVGLGAGTGTVFKAASGIKWANRAAKAGGLFAGTYYAGSLGATAVFSGDPGGVIGREAPHLIGFGAGYEAAYRRSPSAVYNRVSPSQARLSYGRSSLEFYNLKPFRSGFSAAIERPKGKPNIQIVGNSGFSYGLPQGFDLKNYMVSKDFTSRSFSSSAVRYDVYPSIKVDPFYTPSSAAPRGKPNIQIVGEKTSIPDKKTDWSVFKGDLIKDNVPESMWTKEPPTNKPNVITFLTEKGEFVTIDFSKLKGFDKKGSLGGSLSKSEFISKGRIEKDLGYGGKGRSRGGLWSDRELIIDKTDLGYGGKGRSRGGLWSDRELIIDNIRKPIISRFGVGRLGIGSIGLFRGFSNYQNTIPVLNNATLTSNKTSFRIATLPRSASTYRQSTDTIFDFDLPSSSTLGLVGATAGLSSLAGLSLFGGGGGGGTDQGKKPFLGNYDPFGGNLWGKSKAGGLLSSKPTGYAPDLFSMTFGISGTPSRSFGFTGFEARPLLGGSRKRKKRKTTKRRKK